MKRARWELGRGKESTLQTVAIELQPIVARWECGPGLMDCFQKKPKFSCKISQFLNVNTRLKNNCMSQLNTSTGPDSACRRIMVTSVECGKVPINDTQHKGRLSEIHMPYPSPTSYPLCPHLPTPHSKGAGRGPEQQEAWHYTSQAMTHGSSTSCLCP